MKFSLPSFALRRPVTVVMVVITLLGLGAVAWYRTPIEFLPRGLEFPFIRCWIPYPGSTPEQVVNEVAIPAEGQFKTVPHLKRIRTYADSGGCSVSMLFDWDADMALAAAEVRDRMERLKLQLPAEIDHLYLHRHSSDAMPVMALGLFREGDEEDLAHLARTALQPRLIRQEGVAEVSVFSKPEREVLIEFDQDALRSRRLGLYEVVGALQTSSLNVSVGELVDGQTNYYVRVLDEFARPEAIADLVVGPKDLRLKDVATVGYRAREVDYYYALDGKPGVFIIVRKESEANTIAACRAVRDELDHAMSEPAYAGAEKFVFFDQSELILGSLNALERAGKYGGGLALIVLFLFLRRIGPTLIVALAIPASLVTGLVYMFFAGQTLNVVTMSALMIAIGMLVDNSIVVIENIYRYRQLGMDPVQSASRGASEVGLAITAATLTTAVAFIPVAYIETGEMAVYLRQFAAPIVVALGASLLIALTVIPLAASHMTERGGWKGFPPARGLGGKSLACVAGFRRFHPLQWTIRTYARSLGLAMRWRFATVVLLAALVAITCWVPFKKVGWQMMPPLDTRQVSIGVEFDQNFDLDMVRDHLQLLKAYVDAQRDEVGIKNLFVQCQPSYGRIEAHLLRPEDLGPGETIPYSTEDVLNILWQRLPARLPGAELHFSIPEAGQQGDTRGISVLMRGKDIRLLETYAERFAALLEDLPNVTDVDTSTERPKQEIQLQVDEALAQGVGISPMVLARSVDFALRGRRLTPLKQGGKEIPVWAQFREEDRKTRANLDNVTVLGAAGSLVPLNQLVSLNKGQTPQTIRRVDGKNVVTLTAKTSGDNLAPIQADIERLIEAFELPPGYSVDLGDKLVELETSAINFLTALIFGVILIYIVMSALFESYLLPFSILTTVLLAFIGVFWLMFLTDTSFDTIAFVGCILMMGIVVNNGIVIVDHINHLRKNGLGRYEAIVQAGHDRFRPVMMTALTTILGCLPMALKGEIGSAVTFVSLSRALIGGLTTGTVLTLFIVPLFYSLIDDLRAWFVQYFANLAGLRKAAGS